MSLEAGWGNSTQYPYQNTQKASTNLQKILMYSFVQPWKPWKSLLRNRIAKHRDLPASACRVMELKECGITFSLHLKSEMLYSLYYRSRVLQEAKEEADAFQVDATDKYRTREVKSQPKLNIQGQLLWHQNALGIETQTQGQFPNRMENRRL